MIDMYIWALNIEQRLRNYRYINIQFVLGYIAICLFLSSCANQVSPTGGDPDKTPPELVRTKPISETLFFEGNSVRIYFNEAVKKPTYGKRSSSLPYPIRILRSC